MFIARDASSAVMERYRRPPTSVRGDLRSKAKTAWPTAEHGRPLFKASKDAFRPTRTPWTHR